MQSLKAVEVELMARSLRAIFCDFTFCESRHGPRSVTVPTQCAGANRSDKNLCRWRLLIALSLRLAHATFGRGGIFCMAASRRDCIEVVVL